VPRSAAKRRDFSFPTAPISNGRQKRHTAGLIRP